MTASPAGRSMTTIGEFELIERWFTRAPRRAALGVGDDCALIAPAPGHELAVSTDLLIEGRHFLSTVDPQRLGHKALAVNLSDLAACGATPLAYTLALALPQVDERFLDGFARGLHALADAHAIDLVGGDTTRGPLAIAITVLGEVPAGAALRRNGARAGDTLWVSGTLGDARLALEQFRGTVELAGHAFARVRHAMETPTPRIALGRALRGLATSAIDVSDGFVGDLAHVLRASSVGATVDVDALPRSPDLRAQPSTLQRLCTLAGGDDYELVFTAPDARADGVRAAAAEAGVAVAAVGRIDAQTGLRLVDARGDTVVERYAGFDHFHA
jgi:thiamine-monophosphate kinase